MHEAFVLERGIYCSKQRDNFKTKTNSIGDIGTTSKLCNRVNGNSQCSVSNNNCNDRTLKFFNKNGANYYCDRRKEKEKHHGQSIPVEKFKIKQDSKKSDVSDVPDGNWGWVIVFSSFLIQFIIIGFDGCSGILFLKFLDRYRQSAAITAWLGSLATALRLLLGNKDSVFRMSIAGYSTTGFDKLNVMTGSNSGAYDAYSFGAPDPNPDFYRSPVASCLCNRFTERNVIIISGTILAASMIFTGLAPNIYYAFFTFGILGGIGRSLAYCPAIVMVGVYFKQKQGLATGIAASGCGIGGFALTLLASFLFNQCGFSGAFILLGGISLQIVALGSLMRPLSVNRRIEGTSKRNNNTNADSFLDNKIYTISTSLSISILDERCKQSCGNVKIDSKTKSKILEFSVLKDSRFLGFCVTMMLSSLAEQSAFVFLPAFAEEIGILGEQSSAYTVAITSVFSTFAKIITGFIFDHSLVRPHRVYLYNLLMCGLVVVTFLIPSVTTFLQLAVVCALYGLFAGSYMAQKSVIIVDILGRDKLKHSYGILMMFQGIGSLVGPPLSGLFKDINGRYDAAFYIGGTGMFIGTLILFINNVVHAIQKRNIEKRQNTSVTK